MKTTEEYHDLNIKCDVLWLEDVFEKFRNKSIKTYGLFPKHYLSAPALTRDAMLNIKKEDLITDADMYIFFKKRMRSGIHIFCNRYSKVNKSYLKSYEAKQESNHITYLHTNNLYGYAMPKFSTNGINWIDPKEFEIAQ